MVGRVNLNTEFAQRKLDIKLVEYRDGVLVEKGSTTGVIVEQKFDAGQLAQAKCPVTGMQAYFNRIGWYYGSLPYASVF
ncbi:MAG: hypothetical protein IBX55_12060 [Methyloprofundus sp.]|nr:hypothetical protein [Methyloprofundus sp.]